MWNDQCACASAYGSIGVGAARSVFTSMTTVLFEANARSSAG